MALDTKILHKAWIKRLIRGGGYILLIACIGFLLSRLWSIRQTLSLEHLGWDTLLLILLCGLSFALSQLLLSTAWQLLLKWWGVSKPKLSWCHSLYGRTQIAKYLPGNVFHFAGRQMATKYFSASQAAIAGASLLEILGLFLSSGLLALAGMAYYRLPHAAISPEALLAMLACAVFILLMISFGAQRLAVIKGVFPADHKGSSMLKQILPAYSLYALFFLIYSAHMAVLIQHISGLDCIENFGRLLTLVSIAWLAGYIAPGAPGGLGVREALLVLGLTPLIGEADAIIAAFSLRIVTLLGDLFFFLLALKIPLPTIKKAES
ncbi:MAG: hypothetical protein GQ582_00295 [Methyloprofundus sp.]|nr:hypothetical protein [Methyloprofundus sp.]